MKYKILLALALALVSCNEAPEATTPETSTTENPTMEKVILAKAPENAQSITEVRKDPTPGKKITLSGKVMGRMEPFVEGRAILVLGDPDKITSCDLHPGDGCTTPWDVCCDDDDVIKASVATIQVVDADGKLIKQGLKGFHDIKELSKLVVTGTIAEGSNADALIVNATGIYIK